jgi:hypothetical protein
MTLCRIGTRGTALMNGLEEYNTETRRHGASRQWRYDEPPQHISCAVPPLPAGSYTEYLEVYDVCCLSASLSASEEDDRMVRLLGAFTRAVKVEEAVGNWVSERAAAPDGSGAGDKEPAGQPREQASVLPQLNSLCFRSSPASEYE